MNRRKSASVKVKNNIAQPGTLHKSSGYFSPLLIINDAVHFYIYSGYSFLDKFKVRYLEAHFSFQNTKHTNKILTAFASVKSGFSHISYNSYKVDKIVDSETGDVTTYKPYQAEDNKNLFGLGMK